MKQFQLSKLFLGALCVMALGLSACGKKDGSAVRVSGRGGSIPSTSVVGANGQQQQVLPPNTGTCQNHEAGTGSLETSTGMVLGLVSATINPKSFESICRVNFSAKLKFDPNGNISSNNSFVLLQVIDAWVGQTYEGKVIKPYEILFRNVTQGYYNKNTGEIQVSFADGYGTFVINGRVQGAVTTGVVFFMNNVSVDSSISPAQGTLGNFSIPSAALLN
jgi:hypothetical protein